jgi:hypothetical protein
MGSSRSSDQIRRVRYSSTSVDQPALMADCSPARSGGVSHIDRSDVPIGAPALVPTPFLSIPGADRAIRTADYVAEVLFITLKGGLPLIHYSPNVAWGLHLVDGNTAVGNLVAVEHDKAVCCRRSR